MEIPVYLFTGFLEAGKTKMIQETLEDKDFNAGERTLLLVCEEGLEEYDPSRFSAPNVYLQTVEKQEDLTEQHLSEWVAARHAERVLIEYNGMWMLDVLYRALPQNFSVIQEMMFADASTIFNYNANMRSLVVDKLQSCEMVVFNRKTDAQDEMELHKLVRGVSRNAVIAYEDAQGEVSYDEIEDPLPFDLEAPIVEIANQDFALFYRDLVEETGKYDGKVLRFLGIVARDPKLPQNTAMIGRHVMTCCAEDIAYRGLAMVADHPLTLKTRDWVTVEGKIKIEKHPLYNGLGPVLYVTRITPAKKPDPEVATFY